MKVLKTHPDGTVLVEATIGEIQSLYASRGAPITEEQILDCALSKTPPPKLPPLKREETE